MLSAGSEGRNVYKFRSDKICYGDETILQPIELELKAGSTIAILGASGCGKTTLLNKLAGLAKNEVHCWNRENLDIGYLFQEPRLLPWRTINQNLALIESDSDKVAAMLQAIKLSGYGDHYPSQISLGMARRVSLARCLLLDPEMVLMDEPLTSLDMSTGEEMRELISHLVCENPKRCMIYVTHDLDEALALADEVVVLKGRPATVYLHKATSELSRAELESVLKA